ncbi:MAG TPA: LamB/YcsF family protein [Candidatus Gastranaerophilales bacterium]|nr:LamB/YcsF family protein [Candidatus Gastranaerophilales bacterium]
MSVQNIKREPVNNKKLNIDINCDLGQSFGVYRTEIEQELLPYVSSVNLSCGSHAGDPLTIMNILKTISGKNLSLGAHVGYPDLQGFGYRAMSLNEEEMQSVIVYQIGALSSLAKIFNFKIEYVRPHGALYKQISESFDVAFSVAKAIAAYDPWLILVGPPGENLIKAGEAANLRIVQEVQLDKKYNIDGSIDFEAGDVVDLNYSLNLLESLVRNSSVLNNQGGRSKIDFKTIHLSLKSNISLEIAKKAKELIPSAVPVAGTLVANSGWLD